MSLELSNLHLRYGVTEVLRGAALTVKAGERLALIGPNGAGKTSLFDLIGGWRRPSTGQVLWRGLRIDGRAPQRIARMGLGRSHQVNRLFPQLTVAEHLRCVLMPPPQAVCFWRRASTAPAGLAGWLDRLSLARRADTPAAVLSYAEQRQLEIGLAAAGGAELLLLDEPTAGMSRSETARCVDLVRRLAEGRTLVMIEHDMAVVFDLSQRIAVLDQGRFIAVDTPERVRADPAVRQAYLGRALAGDR
jgi:branched-chain amino acid transport system ATP-binding protein